MSDRLAAILESTRARVAALDTRAVTELEAEARDRGPTRSLRDALRRPGKGGRQAAELRVIGEIKRRSPSVGAINENLDVRTTARSLASAGCRALSVLTEPEFFGGSLENLRLAREEVDLPLLRKDFVVDPRQVAEARAAGADAILLLAAALDDSQIARLRDEARRWQLDVLAEAHGRDEWERLVAADVEILGLNARDLHSFEVSLDRVMDWAHELGARNDRVVVAESGILTAKDAQKVIAAPVDAALVGEGLMRGGDCEQNYRELFPPTAGPCGPEGEESR